MDTTNRGADITVTSATRSEAESRADFGLPPEEKPPVTPPPAEGTPPPIAAEGDADAELAAALDTIEPPAAGETPDQKKARQSRSTKQILKNIALRKQAEDRAVAAERELDRLRTAPPKAEVPPTPAPKPGAPPAAGSSAAPEFTFPTWEVYQGDHPDAEYHTYIDERSDARYAFNDQQRQVKDRQDARDRAEHNARVTFSSEETSFKAAHPDYDEKVTAFTFEDGPTVVPIQQLVLKAGKDGPAILYYLATHGDDATRLLQSRTPGELLETFGEIKYAAKVAATPPAAPVAGPAPPKKPTSTAPAPVSTPKGSADATRSLHAIAEDDEDADAYIARRTADQRAAGTG